MQFKFILELGSSFAWARNVRQWNVYLIRANLHFKMATIGIWTN